MALRGEKKADSLLSRGEVAIALLGVWNWKKDGQMILDWEGIPPYGPGDQRLRLGRRG